MVPDNLYATLYYSNFLGESTKLGYNSPKIQTAEAIVEQSIFQ